MTVSEEQGTAEVCIVVGNQIESAFTIVYTTEEISDGANGELLALHMYIISCGLNTTLLLCTNAIY